MLIVPFTSDYSQTFVVQLGGVKYIVDATWNELGQLWTFDLTRQPDGALLQAGIPLLSGQDVLSPYGLGIGGLVVTDFGGTNTDAGPDDLGDRVVVTYLTTAELAFLANARVPGISNPGPVPPSFGGGGGIVPVPGTAPIPPGPGPGPSPVPPPTPGGGGGGGGGSVTITNGFPFGDPRTQADNTGSELLAYQFAAPAGTAVSLTPALYFLASAASSATVRVYLSNGFGTLGTYGTPSGSLAGSATISAGGLSPYALAGSPVTNPNPGGIMAIKVTLQASGGDASIAGLQGVVG